MSCGPCLQIVTLGCSTLPPHTHADKHSGRAASRPLPGTCRGTVLLAERVVRRDRVSVNRRGPAESASFAGYRFPPQVILLAVRWYLRYGVASPTAGPCDQKVPRCAYFLGRPSLVQQIEWATRLHSDGQWRVEIETRRGSSHSFVAERTR
jgi:hypothetical protein